MSSPTWCIWECLTCIALVSQHRGFVLFYSLRVQGQLDVESGALVRGTICSSALFFFFFFNDPPPPETYPLPQHDPFPISRPNGCKVANICTLDAKQQPIFSCEPVKIDFGPTP